MFTFAQWVARLSKGYFKATGKKPDGLAKIKIQMEAAQRVKDQNKVVPFRYKKSFKQELDEMKPTAEDFIKKDDWDPSGMASGGIARVGMVGGGALRLGALIIKNLDEAKSMLGRFDPDLFIKQPRYKQIINNPNAEAKNSAQFYVDELKEIPNISEDTGRRLDSISFDISEAKTADDITRAIDEIDSLSRDLAGSNFASGGRIGMFKGLLVKGSKAYKAAQKKKLIEFRKKYRPGFGRSWDDASIEEMDKILNDIKGLGSLDDFVAEFYKQTGKKIKPKDLKKAYEDKLAYPHATPIIDDTGRVTGGSTQQKLPVDPQKFEIRKSDWSIDDPVDLPTDVVKKTEPQIGKFTKAEVLIQRLKNTLKESNDPYVKKNFPNWIKEIEANPKLADNENVWKNLGGDLPADQKLIVHSDDSVDFFRQTERGPHNIELTDKFMKENPFLTRETALDLLHMDPADRILELERLKRLSRGKPHASGGLAYMLGEPTYSDGGRIGFKDKGRVDEDDVPSKYTAVPEDMTQEEWEDAIKALIARSRERWHGKYQSGGIAGQLHLNRPGFNKGKKVDLSKRKFMKGAGAGLAFLATLPGIGKFFKPAAKLAKTKSLTSVPITQTANMPDWFVPLINKVIKEGDNTTRLPPNKGGAYLDRQTVHSAKLGEGQEVRVYQNLDDQSIHVEYKSADNMDGVAGDGAVHLEYKAGKNVEQGKGVKTEPEFSANEAWPYQDPDDYKSITWEGENKVSDVNDLMSDTSALKQFGTGKALTKEELKIAKQKRNEVNKINNDENEARQLVMDDRMPDDYAQGGIAGQLHLNRPGFNKGKKVDLSKRKFLKGTGAAVGVLSMLPFVGKFFKPAAKAVKSLTSVPITQTGDMPQWFVPLVNKVIKEGDDVTKTFGEVERQIVHKTKLPDSKTDVIVTQDLSTGDVAVDIGMGKHGWGDGHLGQPVRLEYKASEWIEPNPAGGGYITSQGKEVYPGMSKGAFKTEKTTGKGLKTKEEFWVEEAEFTGGHPENIKFEESTFEKFGAHGSDFSEVEKFATGKVTKTKPSIKAERAHWVPEEDYAAGGIAEGGRVPLGGIAGQLHLNQGGRVSFTKGGLAHILGV